MPALPYSLLPHPHTTTPRSSSTNPTHLHHKRWRTCTYYDTSCDRYRIAIISIIVLIIVLKILILFLLFQRYQKRKERRMAGAKMVVTEHQYKPNHQAGHAGWVGGWTGNGNADGTTGLSRSEQMTREQIQLSEGQAPGQTGVEKPAPAYSPEIVR